MTSMIGNTGMRSATGGSTGQNMTGNTSMQKLGGYRHFKTQTFTPEQMQLFSQLFGQVGPESFLAKLAGGDQSMFEQLEAPAMRQFQGLQGQLASRFSGMGTGARKSSGFQNTANQAASDFAQQLQSQRLGLQRQALGDLMGFSNQLLGQRPYEQFAQPKGRSFLEDLTLGTIAGGSEVLKGLFSGRK
jgi:hypothetical protein